MHIGEGRDPGTPTSQSESPFSSVFNLGITNSTPNHAKS